MFGFPGGGDAAGLEAEGLLEIPSGWYYAGVEQEGLTGVLFSKQSPQDLAVFDDPVLAVPIDFAGGAFVKTDFACWCRPPGDAGWHGNQP